MKIIQTLPFVATLVLGLGLGTCHSQTYYYSGPFVDSSFSHLEVGLSPYGVNFHGGFLATFGTLTETIYYDPIAQTFEEVGSFTINPSSSVIQLDTMNYLPFGAPLESGSATLTLGDNGVVSFDRVSSVGSGGGPVPAFSVPVSAAGIYNGQAFTGSWNLNIYPNAPTIINVSPTSITFSESTTFSDNHGQNVIPGTDLYSSASSDSQCRAFWNLAAITAAAVPEPNSLALLGLGLGAALLNRFRGWRNFGKRSGGGVRSLKN